MHHDSWKHFKQSGADLVTTFNALGFGHRIQLLEPGVATVIAPRRKAA